jgi:hypothetical protein
MNITNKRLKAVVSSITTDFRFNTGLFDSTVYPSFEAYKTYVKNSYSASSKNLAIVRSLYPAGFKSQHIFTDAIADLSFNYRTFLSVSAPIHVPFSTFSISPASHIEDETPDPYEDEHFVLTPDDDLIEYYQFCNDVLDQSLPPLHPDLANLLPIGVNL